MPGVVADRVVVELEAKLDKYDANVRNAAKTFDTATQDIERSTGVAVAGHQRLTASVGNSRIAMLEFQHIARGTADQIAAGAPLTQVLVQHMGMLGEAVTLAGGTFGRLGAFLGGPWGLALTVATAAVATLVLRHKEETDTVEAVFQKRVKMHEQTLLNKQADEAWAHTLDGLLESLQKTNDELGKRLQLQPVIQRQALQGANAQLLAIGRELAGAEDDPNTPVVRLQKLRDAFKQATKEVYLATIEAGDAQGEALNDMNKRVEAWIALQRNHLRYLEGVHPELLTASGFISGALDSVQKAMLDAAAVNVPLDAITKEINKLNDKLRDSPNFVQSYVKQMRALADQLERTAEAAKKAGKIDPIASFKSSVIGAEGTGPNRMGSSAAGIGQFMPSTWLSYFNRLFPQFGNLPDAAKLDFRNDKNTATAVIDKATDDYVKVLEAAGQQITAAALYTVHVLGQRDAQKFFAASPDASLSSVFGAKHAATLQAQNPGLLLGTVGATQAAFSKRIGDSSSSVSQASLSIATELTKLEDELHAKALKILGTETAVSVVKERQVDLAGELLGSQNSLQDILNQGAPALQAWNKEFDQIIASQEELNRFGMQLIDDIFNPDNWKSWGDAGKRILKELALEFLQLAALNPLKNLLFGAQLPTLGGGSHGGILGSILKIFGSVVGAAKGAAPGGIDLSGYTSLSAGYVPKFASGGNVQAGQLIQVNENGIEGFRPAQSGTIIPLGRMRGMGGGGTIVHQTFVLDARYGITTPELLRHVNAIASTRAVQAGHAAFDASQRAAPGRFQKLNKLGT